MKTIIERLVFLTARDEPFVLATVISRNSSAPRSAGARMLVQANGATAGTVGGGILEAQVEKLAGEVFKTRTSIVEHFQFSGKDASTMEAICGGQVDVLVEWVNSAESTWKTVLESISSSFTRHKNAWLLTALPDSTPSKKNIPFPSSLNHAVVQKDGPIWGLSRPILRLKE